MANYLKKFLPLEFDMGTSVIGLPRNRFEANFCVFKVGEICSAVVPVGAGGKGHSPRAPRPPGLGAISWLGVHCTGLREQLLSWRFC